MQRAHIHIYLRLLSVLFVLGISKEINAGTREIVKWIQENKLQYYKGYGQFTFIL